MNTTTTTSRWIGLVCGGLLAVTAQAQTVIEDFEYAGDAELLAVWTPQAATLSLSPWVAAGSTGTKSMRVDRNFGTGIWEFEVLTPAGLAAPLAIGADQYLTFRVTGEPQFTNASFQTLFLYAYDGAGNFGRWGEAIPTKNTNWYVFNFLASSIQLPWDSPGAPDLGNIVQFKFYLFGQGDPAGVEYPATIYLDDLVIRDTPLVETPPAVFGAAMIEDFEYADDAELAAAWTPQYPGLTTMSLSDFVSANTTGKKSLRVERNFGTVPWETEVITGPVHEIPRGITSTQYLTFRVSGDPQFANASWQTLFLYAYDGAGNFARWGAPVPTTTNWQVFNFLASSLQYTWDQKGPLNLSNVVQFKFFLYGQGDPAGSPYTATVYVDDLQIRNTPLIELPPPSAVRPLIDDFEGYADDTALLGFYSYQNSPAATITTASLETPAPQGNKALKMTIDFAAGQYPWGSVRSALVAPFSLPANAVVSFRLKGDPTLAPVADAGTTFWLSFYDEAGRGINFSTPAAPLISSEWTTLKARFDQFWTGTVVDTGNLVQWRILAEGWMGTPESAPQSATIYVDDIRVTVPPVLAVVRDGGGLKLQMNGLIPGTTYTLQMTSDFSSWSTTTINATSTSATWPIPAGQKSFFQLFYTP
ncbi:MAG TPA: hypothetical protein VI136_06480 [Verrucomicrobiae bacterium]